MGACLSLIGGTYTMEDLVQEVGQVAGTLPRLQQSSYGNNVLELKGIGWIFNPKIPFDASILRGKITTQKYFSSVNQINRAHMEKMVGMDKLYGPSEILVRRQIGKTAVEETIKTLNKKAIGYHWDLQAGKATTTVTGVSHYGGDHASTTTEHKQETSLLLIFD